MRDCTFSRVFSGGILTWYDIFQNSIRNDRRFCDITRCIKNNPRYCYHRSYLSRAKIARTCRSTVIHRIPRWVDLLNMHPIPKGRIEQFSDGVFAIAITLLALELHVPQLLSQNVGGSIRELLLLVPNIATFILSFMTIAIFWVNHQQLTQSMTNITRRTLWLNTLLLMFITLIPFVTSVATENAGNILAAVTYSFVLFATSLSFTTLVANVHHQTPHRGTILRRSIVGPVIYGCAVIACFIAIPAAYTLLIIPPVFYFLPRAK